MCSWNCCRTCLGKENLNPIFPIEEHHEKFTKIIFSTTGITIEINDSLPKTICTECINLINNSYKFRKKCETTEEALRNQIKELRTNVDCKSGILLKTENQIMIDISDLLTDKELEDEENSTLTDFNYQTSEKADSYVEVDIDTALDMVMHKKTKEEKIVKRTRSKKENKDVKPKEKVKRPREEIKCETCDKILTSRLSLRNHYKIHTGYDVVCEHCGKKFITRRLLLMHCRAKHGYEKTDKCSYCDYKASNAEQVKIHERLHTGEKPYVCSECGVGFHRRSSYLQHVAIHLPDKTVPCDQCSARFKSVTLMRIHKNRHRAPQYSFQCRVCRQGFARRRNVARHLQRLHALPPDDQHILRAKIG